MQLHRLAEAHVVGEAAAEADGVEERQPREAAYKSQIRSEMSDGVRIGKVCAMNTTIDSAGRIVVPKAIRDQLGFRAGTRLRLRVREGRLELEPEPAAIRLEQRDEGLVATSDDELPMLDTDDVRAVIEQQRR